MAASDGGWRADPSGGFIRDPPPAEMDSDDEEDENAIPYGWKPDPSGGLIKMSDAELPPPRRKGYWCPLIGLGQHTHMNGKSCARLVGLMAAPFAYTEIMGSDAHWHTCKFMYVHT